MGLPTFAQTRSSRIVQCNKPTQLQRIISFKLLSGLFNAIDVCIQPKMKQKLSITMDEETVHDIDNLLDLEIQEQKPFVEYAVKIIGRRKIILKVENG